MEIVEKIWREIKIFAAMSADFSGSDFYKKKGWPHPFVGSASNEQIGYIAQLQARLKEEGKRTILPTFEDLIEEFGDSKEDAHLEIEGLLSELGWRAPDTYWQPPMPKEKLRDRLLCKTRLGETIS